MYEVDFGVRWRYEIVYEGFPQTDTKSKFPFCLEGVRACPPEEIGGHWGYAEV
ncbi:IS1096 element passenger TnpR family protein [Planctomicrobium sp. SH668]|uniref:IS1096 element passenger TnpR family protein n=1 Tax=Planctomicrobium sp. SH668 TaxID=3448126 RepID=UPI003F5C9B51